MQMDLPQIPGNELGVVVVREAEKLNLAPLTILAWISLISFVIVFQR